MPIDHHRHHHHHHQHHYDRFRDHDRRCRRHLFAFLIDVNDLNFEVVGIVWCNENCTRDIARRKFLFQMTRRSSQNN